MKSLIFLALVLAPAHLNAQDDFDKFPLHHLCSMIDDRRKDPDPDSDFVYMYQKNLSESAGITKNDSEEAARSKMQTFWRKWGHRMTCSNTKFNTPNGSVIKFAIKSQFTAFFDDVVNNWKLDLNVVDPVDGKTLLDFVEDQLRLNRGTEIEVILKDYREILKKKGAKRAKE